ncbi:FixH family protein [Parasediminibacterium sp. JCM 36343]|uniref:FixH family protein n=1 Tax=Parasediminibacterium sp. JCM 36343 TaxID=3374279 RepID=UPI00397B07A0
MNWGKSIIIVFIAFAGLMLTLVYKTINTKFELVSTEYYKDELVYQDRIDGVANSNKLDDLVATKNTEGVLLSFPAQLKDKTIKGEAWFYCKTDATKDRKIPLAVNGNLQQSIPFAQLATASYQVKIAWVAGSTKYYCEKEINIY